jgi:sugar phosphate permease
MYMIVFLDKGNISVVAPVLMRQFGFNKASMGFLFSAFVLAYGLGQVPGGWLADRFGSRSVLGGLVAVWSVLTVITGLGASYMAFVTTRFLTGLAEAGAFPAATRAMQSWFTRAERGFAQGVTHSFTRLGSAIVPPLGVSLTLAFGWRAVFYFCGTIGICWAVAFYALYRNRPEEHPWVSQAELAHLLRADPGRAKRAKSKIAWRRLLSSPNMWFMMAAYGCYNYGIYFFTAWLPTYLVTYRRFSLAAMGLVAALPLLAGMVGDTVGGVITDRILVRTNNLTLARKVVAVPALSLAAVFLIPAALTHSPQTAVCLLAASLFCMECFIGPAWALPMDVGGEHSGTVAGLMNTAGNLGGALSPIVFGALVQKELWATPFMIQAAVLLAGAMIWLFLIRPEQSVVDDIQTPLVAAH